jgi:hypothetical protein
VESGQPYQRVFLLMPFRHTQKSIPRLRKALEALETRREADVAHAELLGGAVQVVSS